MKWSQELFQLGWSQEIINYKDKLSIAKAIASFVNNNDVIGFGSGSTSFLATKEIAKRVKQENLHITAIPTSHEIKMECIALDISVATINDLKPDWSFDGADEIDPDRRLIKGRGGAMFNEKLIMSNSPKTYIIADQTKFVTRLGERFPIPIESVPSAYISVSKRLLDLGASKVNLRLSGVAKDGPVITENGNYILDAYFSNIENILEYQIKSIVGVVESGLFVDYNIEIIEL
jgi:ribose 5-phosphate isomerase A